METKLIDPIPDRKLLDHNFEGYKLAQDNKKIASITLTNPVLTVKPVPRKYSLLHAQIFGLHNYLMGECTDTYENIYYIDNEKNVKKGKYDKILDEIEFCKLWTFPDSEEVSNSDRTPDSDSNLYIPSLKFVSPTLAVVSDGIKTFWLLETGKRTSSLPWKILHSEELLQGKGFFIQDAVLKNEELHVLLCSIETGGRKSYLVIYWITLTKENKVWKQKSLKELFVQEPPGYVYLERTCEAIYVASTTGCKFVFDSENIIMDTSNPRRKKILKTNFKWSQDSNFIAIHFLMPHDIEKGDVQVNCQRSHITVEYKNTSFLDGALYSIVNPDLTTVSVTKNLLEITLAKIEKTSEWTSLLLNYDTSKQYVGGIYENMENKRRDQTEQQEQGLTFCSESVEECDFANSGPTILERLCATSHRITHRCDLGSGPILITMAADEENPPSFGVRYDVDVCIWEPRFRYNQFELKHTATLLGQGYIQASTNRKKFMCCPANFEYTLICDMSRHILFYRQNTTIESGELVYRTTGSGVQSAEHKVFTVPDEEILGIYALSHGFYVLGESYLKYFEV